MTSGAIFPTLWWARLLMFVLMLMMCAVAIALAIGFLGNPMVF